MKKTVVQIEVAGFYNDFKIGDVVATDSGKLAIVCGIHINAHNCSVTYQFKPLSKWIVIRKIQTIIYRICNKLKQ